MTRRNPTPTRTITSTITGRSQEFDPMSAYFRGRMLIVAQQQHKKKKPQPPRFHNDITGKDEPNLNDPDYQKRLAEWNGIVYAELTVLCMIFATRHYLTDEECKRGLAELENDPFTQERNEFESFASEFMDGEVPSSDLDEVGDTLYKTHSGQTNPRVRYLIDYILARDPADIGEFLRLIQVENNIEEEVQAAAESFRSDVQEQIDLVVHSAEIGAEIQ